MAMETVVATLVATVVATAVAASYFGNLSLFLQLHFFENYRIEVLSLTRILSNAGSLPWLARRTKRKIMWEIPIRTIFRGIYWIWTSLMTTTMRTKMRMELEEVMLRFLNQRGWPSSIRSPVSVFEINTEIAQSASHHRHNNRLEKYLVLPFNQSELLEKYWIYFLSTTTKSPCGD